MLYELVYGAMKLYLIIMSSMYYQTYKLSASSCKLCTEVVRRYTLLNSVHRLYEGTHY